ncbi:MAG: molybdopterin molybdenumtransferase [Leptolyngbya foveolarum]|uniref:Molybdopterin molybdenumtransferase n=1 Tax=Leptolyngbya foveolarum TaxID=47253 RepID=A0A2W4TQP1_9CYAN|nr:MAG: molybdopterin molybdenumtransferase [Leptolyngbya foveolarum]
MLTAAEAERLIFTLVEPVRAVESVPLADCLGRVLAVPVRSELDFPHWDNSAMDGYAVRAVDVQQVPVTLQVVAEIPAGTRPEVVIGPGQAARILTGAMMPEGADAVVMQEETAREAAEVTILAVPESGSFVRSRGSFYRAGAELLEAGRAIAPAEIALLAAAQQTQVAVYRRPRVAIISTGSELVEPGQPLGPGQIVDSNQYALAALVAQAGAVPVALGIVPDERAAVKGAIAAALSQADMVLSSGGVSVGDYDYVDAVLAELGATLHIRSVAVKPGKPLTVASFDYAQLSVVGRQVYFGLPGNPASAMVGFWRFVAPAIQRLSGLAGAPSVAFVWAKALTELKAGGKRETYLWGQLRATESGYEFARAVGSHSSGNLVNLANTSGLAVVPMGETHIAAGESVRVLVCKANI